MKPYRCYFVHPESDAEWHCDVLAKDKDEAERIAWLKEFGPIPPAEADLCFIQKTVPLIPIKKTK